MGKPKSAPATGIVLCALAALLAIGLFTFAGPHAAHESNAQPSCTWAFRVLIGIDAVLAIISIVRIFETDEGERRGLSFSAALIGVLIAFTPGILVDLCADPTLPCHVAMQPLALIVGIAVALVGSADLTKRLVAIRKSNK